MAEKKTHTVKEVDELTLSAERTGFMVGMIEAHRLFYNTLTDFKVTFENMWSIYNQGLITGERKAKVEQMQFVLDTLAVFEDVFQDKYDTVIDNHKTDKEFYDDIAADVDLGIGIE